MVAIRRDELVAYQDRKTAERYLAIVRRCHAAEAAAGGDGSFSRTAAHQLHRVVAYKDEYEVARLLLSGRSRIEQAVGPVGEVTWHLHPPMLRALGMGRKLHLGSWARPALTSLASMKRVRGTALDPFGRSKVRRAERQLVVDYVALLERLLPRLASEPGECTRLGGLVDMVRGYEDVKLRNLDRYREALEREPLAAN
jgi:indolepyruvate ferredoxin oxidoreductase